MSTDQEKFNPYGFTVPDATATITIQRDNAPISIKYDAIGARFYVASHFKDRPGIVPAEETCPVLGDYFKKVHKIELLPHEQLAALTAVGMIWEEFKKKLDLRETSPLPTDSPR